VTTPRQIRLKEFPANSVQYLTPSQAYRSTRPQLSPDKSFLLRTDEFGSVMPAQYFRGDSKMILFGGSSTENKYCDESRRFSSIIQKKFLKKSIPIQVLNFGYSGANLLHIFNAVFNKAIPLAPKAVLIVIPANEKRTLGMATTHWNNDKHYSNFFPAAWGTGYIRQKMERAN